MKQSVSRGHRERGPRSARNGARGSDSRLAGRASPQLRPARPLGRAPTPNDDEAKRTHSGRSSKRSASVTEDHTPANEALGPLHPPTPAGATTRIRPPSAGPGAGSPRGPQSCEAASRRTRGCAAGWALSGDGHVRRPLPGLPPETLAKSLLPAPRGPARPGEGPGQGPCSPRLRGAESAPPAPAGKTPCAPQSAGTHRDPRVPSPAPEMPASERSVPFPAPSTQAGLRSFHPWITSHYPPPFPGYRPRGTDSRRQ